MSDFIAYVGGKSKLIDQIKEYMPENVNHIYEPFAGSASVSLLSGVKSFTLMDAQPELVNFLECVRHAPNDLIKEIEHLLNTDTKDVEFYMSLRIRDRQEGFYETCSLLRAARYYYIINTGFNSLYRVNGKGQCNTPWAKGTKKIPLDFKKRILETHDKLKTSCTGIHLEQFDNNDVLRSIVDSSNVEDLFVFIDPPYYETFDQYTKERTSNEFWDRLETYLEGLNQCGIRFLMTNSYHPFILKKFGRWMTDKVPIKYSIAADGEKRGTKFEAFISNKGVTSNEF